MKKRILIFIFLFVVSIDIVHAAECGALLSYDTAMTINDILGMARIGVPVLCLILSWHDIVVYRTAEDESVSNQAYKKLLKKIFIGGGFFLLAIILRLAISIDADIDSLNFVDNPTCKTPELTKEK